MHMRDKGSVVNHHTSYSVQPTLSTQKPLPQQVQLQAVTTMDEQARKIRLEEQLQTNYAKKKN